MLQKNHHENVSENPKRLLCDASGSCVAQFCAVGSVQEMATKKLNFLVLKSIMFCCTDLYSR